jgi:formate hydrogenlyase subunit 3/multisubunit Na+/H+ antiporter MnhD subunit
MLLCGWLAIGLGGALWPSRSGGTRMLFPLGALLGLAIAATALHALAAMQAGAPAWRLELALGLPNRPTHLALDALSSVYLVVLGGVAAGVSLYGAGYFRAPQGSPPGLVCCQYHLFLASMGFVLLAADTYAFLVCWELMALSSYFLVVTDQRVEAIRQAGFLYLLMAHVGALAILLAFGVLGAAAGGATFEALRNAQPSALAAGAAFVLGLIGFGGKAGLVPLHVWLPEAHPAAPTPVSALMSGVMLKMAVYGMLRLSFDLISNLAWWWGLIPVAVGLFSALYGIVFAAAQTDMKRLLAFSSIENLGILFAALGLALVFHGSGLPLAAALALLAVLYHSVNHAFMKSLLFLGTGSVLHATGQRNLGRLGGLIHRMPWVAWLSLVGALAIAGLPPLNGFVSEWLLLQAFLFAHEVPHTFVNMALPLGAGLLALVAALSGYVMVKFFGVVFLGRSREAGHAEAHDADPVERAGLAWLAAACVCLGLLPAQVVGLLQRVAEQLRVGGLPRNGAPWWLLAPVSAAQASYAPLVFLGAFAVFVLLTIVAVRLAHRRRPIRVEPWDCGFGPLDARMQDTAEGFGQPIRQLFEPFFAMQRQLPSAFDPQPAYRVTIGDRFWNLLYLPLGTLTQRAAAIVSGLQGTRLSGHLLYGFVTLILLLALVL